MNVPVVIAATSLCAAAFCAGTLVITVALSLLVSAQTLPHEDIRKKSSSSVIVDFVTSSSIICTMMCAGRRLSSSSLRSAEKKCEKRLGIILARLSECRDIEDVKLKGELITANIYAIERGSDSLKAVNYYDENMPEVTIALDPRLTPAQNAQKYYKRYAKLKRTLDALAVQKKDTDSARRSTRSLRRSIAA